MRAVDPDLDERESFLLAAALREAAEGLPEGCRALLVGQPAMRRPCPGPPTRSSRRWARADGVLLIELDGRRQCAHAPLSA